MSEAKIDHKGITRILESHGHEPAALLAILQDIQEKYGCLTIETMRFVADAMELHVPDIYAAASFYRMFRFEPRGRHSITFCTGTTCHVNHCQPVLTALKKDLRLGGQDTTRDGQFTVEEVHCLGLCHMGPVMKVDDDYHGRLGPKDAIGAISKLKKKPKKKAAKKPKKKVAKKPAKKGGKRGA
jgi:NADH-quinone oxidoreductase subunit E